jgi:cytoskeletal protein RodZ
MKKQVLYLSYLGALALLLSAAISLNAQTPQTPQTQQPEPQSQQPAQQAPPDQSAQENPDTQAQPSQKTGVQTFTGSIVKSGTKFMFQDAASGNTYDIDHQDEVQKFDGKKVTVHGTLDATSNTIHIK